MALGIGNAITASDISSVSRFKEGKVILLKGYGYDSVVVKIESASEAHVKSATLAVKAVDASNRMKVLSAGEIQELENYLAHQKGMLRSLANASGQFFGATTLATQHPGLKDLQDLLAERTRMTGAGAALCKMDQANLMGMDKALVSRWTKGETAQDPLNKFKSALLAKGGMERLGEIVATDLFVANRDRFIAFGGPFTAWVDERGPNERKLSGMKTFHNIGNILLCLTDRGPVMSGLDYVDPNGQGGGMSFKEWKGVTDTEAELNLRWDGRILADKQKRRALASDIIDDIDWLLQACPTPRPNDRMVFPGNGKQAEKQLEKGMIDGCHKIVGKLKLKIKQYGKQADKARYMNGMNERLNILKKV